MHSDIKPQIVEMHKKGSTALYIARELYTSEERVCRALQAAGYQPRVDGFVVTHCPDNLFAGGVFTKSDVGVTCWCGDWPDGMRMVDRVTGAEYTVVRYRQGASGNEHQRLENDNQWLVVTRGTGTMTELPPGTMVTYSHRATKDEKWRYYQV